MTIIQKLKEFPIPSAIEEIEVWDAAETNDPLLIAKVSDQHYSLLSWDRLGPYIILEGE